MEGEAFGNVPLQIELKLEVWDSPNSAGVIIDAVRCAKLAMDRGIGGPLTAPSSYFMKTPPQQFTDDEARRLTEEFIAAAPSVSEPAPQKEKKGAEPTAKPVAQKNGGPA
jgi:myo-inositol-1-phosphate synthase